MRTPLYNFTFKMSSDGETFQETHYAIRDMNYGREMKERLEAVGVLVHNIWFYNGHETIGQKKLLYSESKGWI